MYPATGGGGPAWRPQRLEHGAGGASGNAAAQRLNHRRALTADGRSSLCSSPFCPCIWPLLPLTSCLYCTQVVCRNA
uniref:Uncharacterized protein n=1 Tax=Setaria viridis TaxID=4556 RepID=A0A4V6D405_SETVI|nr:hypothetical protein SEVIR_7G119866v2 [Setaria viridis]